MNTTQRGSPSCLLTAQIIWRVGVASENLRPSIHPSMYVTERRSYMCDAFPASSNIHPPFFERGDSISACAAWVANFEREKIAPFLQEKRASSDRRRRLRHINTRCVSFESTHICWMSVRVCYGMFAYTLYIYQETDPSCWVSRRGASEIERCVFWCATEICAGFKYYCVGVCVCVCACVGWFECNALACVNHANIVLFVVDEHHYVTKSIYDQFIAITYKTAAREWYKYINLFSDIILERKIKHVYL